MKLAGSFGERILDEVTRRLPPRPVDYANNDPYTTSRFRDYFGEATLHGMSGTCVIDMGCGRGADAVALALAGATVVGVDVCESFLADARDSATRHGVAQRCRFINPARDGPLYRSLGDFDAAVSIDAFEHFADPVATLNEMKRLLRPGGRALISFGPPWKHPYGAHMSHFNRMPWIHFVFAEPTIMAVRARYTCDGATRFEDVASGLNRMTVERFEKIVDQSGLTVLALEPIPIRRVRFLARHRALREYVTSMVRAELENR